MHVLITGVTASGKTTLCRKLVQEHYTPKGIGSIVLDPNEDPRWNASLVTADQKTFLRAMYTNRQCALFVDESGEAIGRYARNMMVVTTKSRHFGHKAHLICQRPSQIDKTVRDQCLEVYLFAVGHSDAKTLYDEFRWKEILDAPHFEQGQFLHFGRFKTPKSYNIFTNVKYELNKSLKNEKLKSIEVSKPVNNGDNENA